MRDPNLNQSQKFILAEIEQLATLERGCVASNLHFANLIGITKENVSKNINDLVKKGYIVKENYIPDKEVYKKLNKKNSETGCLFCGYNGVAIDKHHYPIRAKDGGAKTIDLCANCHREFHNLADHRGQGIFINWDKMGISEMEYKEMLREFKNETR